MVAPMPARIPRIPRRSFVAGLSAAGALGWAGRVQAADGKSILIVGDSMIAGGFGLYLERALGGLGYAARRFGKTSSGLARPDFFDWMKASKMLVDEHGAADATVVMFGGNDVQGLYLGHGNWIRWPEEGWAAEYARRVVEFSDIIAPDGQQIFWVGMPVMRPAKFHEKIKRVNWIYRAEMAIRPHALFIDAWRLLADDDGEYADRIYLSPDDGQTPRKTTRVRAGDGIHLSPAGAQHLVDHVVPITHRTLGGEA
jgi:hypothetical protein